MKRSLRLWQKGGVQRDIGALIAEAKFNSRLREEPSRLEDNIEETAIRVCDAMAGAIELYASVSGSGTDDLPEHFVSAYVLATLGPGMSRSLLKFRSAGIAD